MFKGIIGHQAQKDYLARVLAAGTMAQAYCFSGPAQVGKMTMAREFVGLGEEVANPNVTVIGGGSIEEIRDLRERLSLSAFGGGRKIAIIDGADQMTIAAQNALLKTLEEPQGLTTIILIASDAERLLPTILSRTIHLRFTLVERELICKKLVDGGLARELAHELAGFAAGRPGLANTFADPEVLSEFRSLRARAQSFTSSPLAHRIRQIDELVKSSREDKSVVEGFLDQVIGVLHEGLIEDPTAAIHQALQAAISARESLNHNGNRSILLEHVAINV